MTEQERVARILARQQAHGWGEATEVEREIYLGEASEIVAAFTVTPQEAAKVTTDNDLYYLRCISRRLAEFQEAMDGIDALTIGGEAMADERDWLDDYLDRHSRAISEDRQ